MNPLELCPACGSRVTFVERRKGGSATATCRNQWCVLRGRARRIIIPTERAELTRDDCTLTLARKFLARHKEEIDRQRVPLDGARGGDLALHERPAAPSSFRLPALELPQLKVYIPPLSWDVEHAPIEELEKMAAEHGVTVVRVPQSFTFKGIEAPTIDQQRTDQPDPATATPVRWPLTYVAPHRAPWHGMRIREGDWWRCLRYGKLTSLGTLEPLRVTEIRARSPEYLEPACVFIAFGRGRIELSAADVLADMTFVCNADEKERYYKDSWGKRAAEWEET